MAGAYGGVDANDLVASYRLIGRRWMPLPLMPGCTADGLGFSERPEA
jgi:hypothetical protein